MPTMNSSWSTPAPSRSSAMICSRLGGWVTNLARIRCDTRFVRRLSTSDSSAASHETCGQDR